MIKQDTIEQVRSRMDIYEIIGRFITIKRDIACCPFHEEKSPSFHVWKSQQIFKCFGCGASGDAISFVMKHERKTYPEAIEWMASFYEVPVEYEHQSSEENKERQDAIIEMKGVLQFAHQQYIKALNELPETSEVKKYLRGRGITEEWCQRWNLGYAPNEWKFMTAKLINMGRYQPAIDLGLINTKEGNSYDFFRHRIMIPIHDANGVLVAFGARMLPTNDAEADKQQPKYINSKESLLYQKRKVWFGLYQALTAKAIKNSEYVYTAEGYLDVIAMHEAGVQNTVASCGTEADDEQLKLLKRHTDHIVIATDPDKAGMKAAEKRIDRLLMMDYKVEVLTLPPGKDPDEFSRQFMKGQLPLQATAV